MLCIYAYSITSKVRTTYYFNVNSVLIFSHGWKAFSTRHKKYPADDSGRKKPQHDLRIKNKSSLKYPAVSLTQYILISHRSILAHLLSHPFIIFM
jgi:hypothetical protein